MGSAVVRRWCRGVWRKVKKHRIFLLPLLSFSLVVLACSVRVSHPTLLLLGSVWVQEDVACAHTTSMNACSNEPRATFLCSGFLEASTSTPPLRAIPARLPPFFHKSRGNLEIKQRYVVPTQGGARGEEKRDETLLIFPQWYIVEGVPALLSSRICSRRGRGTTCRSR